MKKFLQILSLVSLLLLLVLKIRDLAEGGGDDSSGEAEEGISDEDVDEGSCEESGS